MNPPRPNPDPTGPDPMTRAAVATLLRVGLGLSVLNRGVVGYLYLKSNVVPGSLGTGLPVPPGFEFYYKLLAYADLALGLALVVGFLTMPAAALVGLGRAVGPSLQAALLIGGVEAGAMWNGSDLELARAVMAGAPAELLLVAAVLWLSPIASNRWSLDRLIYASPGSPASPTPDPAPPPGGGDAAEPGPSPAPATPPGEKARSFIARRGE